MEILDLWYWMRQSATGSEQTLVFAEYDLWVLSEGWSVFWYCAIFVKASHSDNRVDQGNLHDLLVTWLTCGKADWLICCLLQCLPEIAAHSKSVEVLGLSPEMQPTVHGCASSFSHSLLWTGACMLKLMLLCCVGNKVLCLWPRNLMSSGIMTLAHNTAVN